MSSMSVTSLSVSNSSTNPSKTDVRPVGTPCGKELLQDSQMLTNDSPVSQLVRNLGELSTSSIATFPRRKLSLSGCTPDSYSLNTPNAYTARSTSVDEGCALESPGFEAVDSPFLQHRLESLTDSYCSGKNEEHWNDKRTKLKKYKTLPLSFYGFGPPVTNSPSPKGENCNLPKAAVDGENEEDESSQDSGVGLDPLPPVSSRISSDQTNSLDRWMLSGKIAKFPSSRPSFERSLSVPGQMEKPCTKLSVRCEMVTKLKSVNPANMLSPVLDSDDGFVELNENECSRLLTEEHDMFSPSSACMPYSVNQTFIGRKRRYKADPTYHDENEDPMEEMLCKMRKSSDSGCRDVEFRQRLLQKSKTAGTDACTPTSLKPALKSIGDQLPARERESDESKSNSVKPARRLVRCHSEAVIRSVLSSSFDEHPNLVGDFSRPYSLPVMAHSKHQDLKSITVETMANVMNRSTSDIPSYVIVDCRYPYEFDGGHLAGAKNIFTKEGIMEEFLTLDSDGNPKSIHDKKIIIFHCEFSSERGPKLMRFLRNKDRDKHRDCYPMLHYPECYLLEGGYKAFFEANPHLCEPRGYRQMIDPQHSADLKHFRSKSRSLPITNNEAARQHRARSCLKL